LLLIFKKKISLFAKNKKLFFSEKGSKNLSSVFSKKEFLFFAKNEKSFFIPQKILLKYPEKSIKKIRFFIEKFLKKITHFIDKKIYMIFIKTFSVF